MSEFSRSGAGQKEGVTRALSADSLLGRPVRLRGIRLGHPSDVLLDAAPLRVVGLEVACGDESRRFLPLAAARVREDEIALGSALLLLQGDDLAFYRRRGRMLSAMRGKTVSFAGRPAGVLRDVIFDPEGLVTVLELEGADGARLRVRPDATVVVDDAPASAA